MTVAEHFRDQGKSVLFMMDSVTRFCLAAREIGLAAGEPPSTRGYPPSVFAELPRLLDARGPGRDTGPMPTGFITALFTVLVEGDDTNEPVADAVRGILDGHVLLDRRIAESGRYPAVDVLRSLSRAAQGCLTEEEMGLTRRARGILALHGEMADLVRHGGLSRRHRSGGGRGAGAGAADRKAVAPGPIRTDRSARRVPAIAAGVGPWRVIIGGHIGRSDLRSLSALRRLRHAETDTARRDLGLAMSEEAALAAREAALGRELDAARRLTGEFDREAFAAWFSRTRAERERLAGELRAAAARAAEARSLLAQPPGGRNRGRRSAGAGRGVETGRRGASRTVDAGGCRADAEAGVTVDLDRSTSWDCPGIARYA